MNSSNFPIEDESKAEVHFCQCCQVNAISPLVKFCLGCALDKKTLKAYADQMQFESDEEEDIDDREERILAAFLPFFATIVTVEVDEEHPYYCAACEKETNRYYSYPAGIEGAPAIHTNCFCCIEHCAIDAYYRTPA